MFFSQCNTYYLDLLNFSKYLGNIIYLEFYKYFLHLALINSLLLLLSIICLNLFLQ